MKEIWKDIPNYESLYQASNLGKIRNKKTNKILKQNNHESGYLRIGLFKNGKEIKYYIQVLMAMTFLDKNNFKSMPYEDRTKIDINKIRINHKDENKHNNNISNLEYCTYSYNNNYGSRNKIVANKNKISHSKKINQYDLNGNFIREWNSMHEIERQLNIPSPCVCLCCKNKQKKSKGYIFKYKEE